MTKKWFTLIELLVVITIITLLTSSWVIYFFRQVSSIQIASEIEKVVDIVDNFDSQIDNKKILDYSLYINKNSLWFTGSINNLGLDNRQYINMNFQTWTWIITSNSWTILKLYSGIKFQKNYIIDSTLEYEYNFSKNIESKILSTYSWATLNELKIFYYSPDNLIINNENKLELIWINSKSDKTWTNYSSLIIKNLNWKKSIKWNGLINLGKIYLFFKREWVEKFIEIKK